MKAILVVAAAFAFAPIPTINAVCLDGIGLDCVIPGYPDCHVYDPTLIGDGNCNNYGGYNTAACGFDGGDCIVPGYPDCFVGYPILIGNGICNNYDGYNTAACGFDGGDCADTYNPSENTTGGGGEDDNALVGTLIGIALLAAVSCIVLVRKNKQERTGHGTHTGRTASTGGAAARTGRTASTAASNFALPPSTAPQSEEDMRMREQRRLLILTSIIHKKVLSTTTKHGEHDGDDADDEEEEILVLPHEESLSLRQSNASSASSENKEEPSSLFSQIAANTDEETGGGIMNKKDDVYVASLRSVRDSMGISVRDVGVDEDSLYSPRCCPICCEDYQKGDAIAWSRNEECHHAFHVDCVLQWLMDNDDCPMCRAQYIDLDAQ